MSACGPPQGLGTGRPSGDTLVARQIGNDRWETLLPAEILAATLGLKPDFRGGIALVDAAAVVGKPSLPVTFVFRTRDGAMGVLQVLSHAGNPPFAAAGASANRRRLPG